MINNLSRSRQEISYKLPFEGVSFLKLKICKSRLKGIQRFAFLKYLHYSSHNWCLEFSTPVSPYSWWDTLSQELALLLILTLPPGVQKWGPEGKTKLDLLCIRDASDHIPETLLQVELGYDRDRAEGTHCLFLLLLEVAWMAASLVDKPP